jgi:membrane protein
LAPFEDIKPPKAKEYTLSKNSALTNVFQILWHKLVYFDIEPRAAAVAFNLTLAVFPGIIFIFTLIPYIPIKNLDLQILNILESVIPKGIYADAKETIIDIVSKKRSGVLSLGFFLSIFTSTSGMLSLMRTFNLTYRTAEKRGIIKTRIVAILLTLLLTFMLFMAIMTLIVGRYAIDFLIEYGWLHTELAIIATNLVRYGVTFTLLFMAVSTIYYFAPSVSNRWNFINYGSITSSILIIGVTNLFSYYLSNFATYNKLYGSIGTIIALMVWMYLVSLILIIGFEINTTFDQAKNLKENGQLS